MSTADPKNTKHAKYQAILLAVAFLTIPITVGIILHSHASIRGVNVSMISLGYTIGAFALIANFWLAYTLGDRLTLNFLLGIFGLALGWVLGMLLSPYINEQAKFSDYGKALSTFISGYGLARLGTVIDSYIKTGIEDKILGRILIFSNSFVLMLLFVFVARMYI